MGETWSRRWTDVPSKHDDMHADDTSDADGGAEAVGEVAAKLVRAYAELRQLDFLLASLTASLQAAGSHRAAVVRSRAFQNALQQASAVAAGALIHRLPMRISRLLSVDCRSGCLASQSCRTASPVILWHGCLNDHCNVRTAGCEEAAVRSDRSSSPLCGQNCRQSGLYGRGGSHHRGAQVPVVISGCHPCRLQSTYRVSFCSWLLAGPLHAADGQGWHMPC